MMKVILIDDSSNESHYIAAKLAQVGIMITAVQASQFTEMVNQVSQATGLQTFNVRDSFVEMLMNSQELKQKKNVTAELLRLTERYAKESVCAITERRSPIDAILKKRKW